MLLELTRPYPGILTFKDSRGAFELIEFPTGMSAVTVMALAFLILPALPLCVGMSRRWLDPDRVATDAMRWAFGSRSLNIAFVVLGLLTVLAVLNQLWFDDQNGSAVIMLFCMACALFAPFFAWNTKTLLRQTLKQWWAPGWPGATAVLLSIAGMVISIFSGAATDVILQSHLPIWMRFSVGATDAIFGFLLGFFVAVAWIGRESLPQAWSEFRRLLHWRTLRMTLWQGLVLLILITVVVIPFFLAAILAIFVIPQYEQWAQSRAQILAPSLRLIGVFGSTSAQTTFAPLLILEVYALLALGRLLTKLGIGQSA